VAASASVPPTAASKPSSDLLEVPEDYADDQVVHRVHPSYPKQARVRKLHGAVVLQAIINKQGKVDSLQLVSGDPLLAQAAADAVKQWRYKPYWHNGEASDFQTRITVDFKQP
jgi:protein TonB